MRRHAAWIVALCIVAAAGALMAAEPTDKDKGNDREKAAADAARKWVELVDAGKYGESWTQAAAFFKGAVPKAQWEQMVGGVRKPLGALVSRTLKGATYMTEVPGAPDGEYVVVQFTTVFKNKKEAVETITPTKEKDGAWRVSGYFIK